MAELHCADVHPVLCCHTPRSRPNQVCSALIIRTADKQHCGHAEGALVQDSLQCGLCDTYVAYVSLRFKAFHIYWAPMSLA